MNLLQNDAGAVSAIAPFVPSFFDAGVDQAQQDFAKATIDYSVTEAPLTSTEAGTAAQHGRSFAYVPFAASAATIAAVVECGQGNSVTPATWCTTGNLELTVPQLAQIFTDLSPLEQPPPNGGGIGTWNDAQLLTLNPGLSGVSAQSHNITAIENVQPSACNTALESLFVNNPTAKAIWDAYLKFFEGNTDDTPTDLWPHTSTAGTSDQLIAQTLIKVNSQVTPPVPDTDPTKWGQGDIAPLPVDWIGPPLNIPAIAIQNAQGAFVAPTVASTSAALGDATMDPTTNLVTFNANPTDAAAYPMPVMSYLVVPTSGLDPAKATALAAFIKFVLGSAGQADVESMGAAGVTPAMVTAGLKVAAQVAAQATTTTTTSTTTPRSTSTTVAPTSSGQGSAGGGSGSNATPTSDTSPSLALTGGVPWPVPLGGSALVLMGFVARRTLRSRITPRGSKP
jgi:ABC-type phosphate transport system substrate-binding protein